MPTIKLANDEGLLSEPENEPAEVAYPPLYEEVRNRYVRAVGSDEDQLLSWTLDPFSKIPQEDQQ